MAGITLVPGSGSRRAYYPRYKIAQGPWTGGLNTVDDPESLQAVELQDCINFIIKPDGTLVQRPPVGSHARNPVRGALPIIDGTMIVTAMGSVIRDSNNSSLMPIVGIWGLTAPLTWSTKFYRYINGAWQTAFNEKLDIDFPNPQGSTGIFTGVIEYNGTYYLGAGGLYSAPNVTGTVTYIANSPPRCWDMLMLRSRMFMHDGQKIYWSKATDPSVWAAPNGGQVDTRKPDNDYIRKILVFQNAVWVIKTRSIERLSFTNDPGVDGTYEVISSENGGYDAAVYNNELYVINGDGVYKFVNGFFVELSAKIRNTFRFASNQITSTDPASGLYNKFGLFKLGPYLVAGPFNYNAPVRAGEAVSDLQTGNMYFVYNLDQQIWTKWLFAANTQNPVGGPVQKVMPATNNNPAGANEYVWVSAVLDNGVVGLGVEPRPQQIYSMNALQLINENAQQLVGSDIGPLGASWIGGLFTTGEITLGAPAVWKKILTSLLTCDFTVTGFLVGTSYIKFLLDGARSITLAPSDSGRLKFGRTLRCKRYSFTYDSITNTAIRFIDTLLPPEVTRVREFVATVQSSQEETT